MPLDPYSYVAASRVKTLLCPVGKIRRSSFFQYADRLSNTFEVRLVDVTPDNRSDRAMFSPLGYPNGKVIYDFSLYTPDEAENFALHDLEPFRQTFVVLGLASYKDGDHEVAGEAELKELKKRHKNAIVHKVLVFGVPNETAMERSKHIIPILSSKAPSFTSLETIMCDITSEFLTELAVYTISRQMGSFKSPTVKELDSPESSGLSIKRPILAHASGTRSGSLTKSGSISLGMTDRSKSRQKGRQQKFTGNMYLLAGRLPDALKELSEAATTLKAAYDHMWHASALDCIGVCLVFMSFLEVPIAIPQVALSVRLKGNHPTPESTPSLVLQSSDDSRIAALTATASASSGPSFTHHQSSSSSSLPASPGSTPQLPDFLLDLVEGVLRFYSRGQGEETVPQVVYLETLLRYLKLLVILRLGGGWNGASLSAIVRGTASHKNVSHESPSKTTISYWCNRIYSSERSELSIGGQCRILSGLASVYAAADMPRKHAFILRELLGMLNKEQQEQQADLSGANTTSYLSILDNSYELGLLGLLDTIGRVYGAGDIQVSGCGWARLKISFLRTAIKSCDLLGDYAGLVHYVTTLLSIATDVLTKEEQLKLYATIHRSIESAHQAGQGNLLGEYFDPYLLRAIRRSEDTKTTSLAKTANSNAVKPTGKPDDVFIYNPFTKQQKNGDKDTEKWLVRNERVDFLVKLQNPFEFEIQIAELSLLTNNDEAGKDIESKIRNVYLPPNSVIDVLVPVVPKSVGKLHISGVDAQVSHCRPKQYLLSKTLLPKLEDKIKSVGVEAGIVVRKWQAEQMSPYVLEYDVLPEQPIIALKHLSLNQGWMTMFEGEVQTFSITLSNFSSISANVLNVNFTDSTTEALEEVLARRDILPNDTYECEYFLHKRQAFELEESSDKEILPHQTATLNIRTLGKRGLQSGMVHIDYGHMPEDQLDAKTVWTRRLTIPLHFTINPTIELGGCNIIPLPTSKSLNFGEAEISKLIENLTDHVESYCVLILDFRNPWSKPVRMNMWSKDPDNEGQKLVELSRTVNPGGAERLLLPVKWKGMNPALLNRAIPSLANRQFIVNSQRATAKQMRETFWYREELLNLIAGSWQLVENAKRYGIVELRGLRVTPGMIAVLRAEQIKISMHIVGNAKDAGEGSPVEKVDSTTWKIPLEYDGAAVRTVLTNMSDEPIRGILRLIPSTRYNELGDNDGLTRKLLYNGWLQRPVRDIQPGHSVHVDLGIVYIAKGEYQWASVFDIMSGEGRQLHGQKVPVYVKVA